MNAYFACWETLQENTFWNIFSDSPEKSSLKFHVNYLQFSHLLICIETANGLEFTTDPCNVLWCDQIELLKHKVEL